MARADAQCQTSADIQELQRELARQHDLAQRSVQDLAQRSIAAQEKVKEAHEEEEELQAQLTRRLEQLDQEEAYAETLNRLMEACMQFRMESEYSLIVHSKKEEEVETEEENDKEDVKQAEEDHKEDVKQAEEDEDDETKEKEEQMEEVMNSEASAALRKQMNLSKRPLHPQPETNVGLAQLHIATLGHADQGPSDLDHVLDCKIDCEIARHKPGQAMFRIREGVYCYKEMILAVVLDPMGRVLACCPVCSATWLSLLSCIEEIDRFVTAKSKVPACSPSAEPKPEVHNIAASMTNQLSHWYQISVGLDAHESSKSASEENDKSNQNLYLSEETEVIPDDPEFTQKN